MKDNKISSRNCLIVNTVSLDMFFMCNLEEQMTYKIDLCGALTKTEKKFRSCILTLSHFLVEVIYTLHRISNINFLKF